jgi:hypothetical protein
MLLFGLTVVALWGVSYVCARAGWKWTLPWSVLLFVAGCANSFLLHALYRA